MSNGASTVRRFEVNGYRSLAGVVVDFAPLTVFVGPNASGKSSLLRVLDPATWRSLRFPQDAWMHSARSITFNASLANGSSISIRAEIPQGAEVKLKGPTDPWKCQALALDADVLRRLTQARHETILERSGANLVNVFDTLPRPVQATVARSFCERVRVFSDVDVFTPPSESGHRALRFYDRWNPSRTFSANDVSDGSLFLLAFLVVQHQTAPVDLVTIEEPERALHPYLIEDIVKGLRDLARGASGRPVQVVMATHSPAFLNYLEPSEVRFVTRNAESGGTLVDAPPVDDPGWKQAYENYDRSLSEMWLSGTLGGV